MVNEELLCSILSVLAMDGKVDKDEMRFFSDVCERLEVTQEQKDAVITTVKQGNGRVHWPENEADKKRLLYFLAQAVVADGVVLPKERHVLDVVMKRMGVEPEYAERFIQDRLQEIEQNREA